MIKIEKTEVTGWEPAIRGMRNPMNSWEKSDSIFTSPGYEEGHTINGDYKPFPLMHECGVDIGPNDLDLMLRLAKAGSVEGKFRRMIVVYADITAPRYWWSEYDTYKVGTVANSCSTMHKIHAKDLTLDDFSHEHLTHMEEQGIPYTSNEKYIYDHVEVLSDIINVLNTARAHYLETKDKSWWWQMIQLLPSTYNQKRTVMLNYEVLSNIYCNRRNHKLDEWRDFCKWIEELPYSEIITCNADTEKIEELMQFTKDYGKIKHFVNMECLMRIDSKHVTFTCFTNPEDTITLDLKWSNSSYEGNNMSIKTNIITEKAEICTSSYTKNGKMITRIDRVTSLSEDSKK